MPGAEGRALEFCCGNNNVETDTTTTEELLIWIHPLKKINESFWTKILQNMIETITQTHEHFPHFQCCHWKRPPLFLYVVLHVALNVFLVLSLFPTVCIRDHKGSLSIFACNYLCICYSISACLCCLYWAEPHGDMHGEAMLILPLTHLWHRIIIWMGSSWFRCNTYSVNTRTLYKENIPVFRQLFLFLSCSCFSIHIFLLLFVLMLLGFSKVYFKSSHIHVFFYAVICESEYFWDCTMKVKPFGNALML